MFIIKQNDKYLQWEDDGLTRFVDKIEEATKFTSKNTLNWALKTLGRAYSSLESEEISS